MITIAKNVLLQKNIFTNRIERKYFFREVVQTTRQAYEVLNKLSRYQNDLYLLNNNFLLQIKLDLDSLTAFHSKF